MDGWLALANQDPCGDTRETGPRLCCCCCRCLLLLPKYRCVLARSGLTRPDRWIPTTTAVLHVAGVWTGGASDGFVPIDLPPRNARTPGGEQSADKK